ncbi:hypothetical protein GCM10011348_05140 [Marinobacterium nitratireducens]|uniref:Uncharacterized protein n=1 Tax=Marinobacterium nitratireducens TaxID=518897 RepID=A0A917Z7I4_9GAMM|nr:hypothetical protein GCM10011348_05140 [Marinobacterium nitratireducens]
MSAFSPVCLKLSRAALATCVVMNPHSIELAGGFKKLLHNGAILLRSGTGNVLTHNQHATLSQLRYNEAP